MCGRYSIYSSINSLEEQFEFNLRGEYVPRYNTAPGQDILTIINANGKRVGGQLRWGLIPHWAKDEKIGFKMINARAETVNEKTSFRKLLLSRRCLIPANGFFEWKKEGKEKYPYHFVMKDRTPFVFAGLWGKWEQNNKVVYSCTIITTEANDITSEIHERMPVILPAEKQKLWLDLTIQDPELLCSWLTPFDADKMERYEVSTLVNSSKNESEELIVPLNSK